MAIFDGMKKKNLAVKSGKPTHASGAQKQDSSKLVGKPGENISSVLLRPRVTEKASVLAEKNTYVFEINPRANKQDVAAAVTYAYKVTPQKVRIVNLPRKRVFSRGKLGMQSGVKKAFVYLKQGDKIEFI
jgi:large subunit ribosomal protein L23